MNITTWGCSSSYLYGYTPGETTTMVFGIWAPYNYGYILKYHILSFILLEKPWLMIVSFQKFVFSSNTTFFGF